MTLFECFCQLSTDKHPSKSHPFLSFLEYLISDECENRLQTWCDNMHSVIMGFKKLPDEIQVAAKKWAEYGWVPCLPEYSLIEFFSAVRTPETQKMADAEMLSKLDNYHMNQLFSNTKTYVEQYGHNSKTFEDAVKCFENKIYTGCALSLFALIDACFIIGQPRPNNKNERRKTANTAVENTIDKQKSIFFVNAYTVKIIVQNLYSNSKDFDEKLEQKSFRNFLSHGMNKYNPAEIDCIKLFVLLYNIYILFNSKVYHW